MRLEDNYHVNPQWIKVEFYGQVPEGEVVTEVSPLEVAANLFGLFGFTLIDGLVISAAEDPRRA